MKVFIAPSAMRWQSLAAWVSALLLLLGGRAAAQTGFDVTAYGAIGDALPLTSVNTVSNSAVIVCPSRTFTAADVGKAVQLFKAGAFTLSTNGVNHHLDLVAFVTAADGNTLTLNRTCGVTTNNIAGWFGTHNAPAFQAAVNAAGTNTIINIPSGTFLLIPPLMFDTNYITTSDFQVLGAVTLQKGGIIFNGAGTNETVLLGNGAYERKPYGQRGTMFVIKSPTTNNAPHLTWQNLTLHGGVAQGAQAYRGWPARWYDGDGWDVTHGAIIQMGPAPHVPRLTVTNCFITKWRGEMLKSTIGNGGTNAFVSLQDCVFYDGNASANNFQWAFHINRCRFDTLDMAMEIYQANADGPSWFENSTARNVRGFLAVVGALTNINEHLITVRDNTMSCNTYGLYTSPGRNIQFINNIVTATAGVQLGGPGAQGNDRNGAVLVAGNLFTNSGNAMIIASHVDNVVVTNNQVVGNASTFITCYFGSVSNFTFAGNTNLTISGSSLNCSGLVSGEWIMDAPSNLFPSYRYTDYFTLTNLISYAYGSRHRIWVSQTNSIWLLDDTQPARIPSGATLTLRMENPGGTKPNPLYLSAANPVAPLTTISAGYVGKFVWTNGGWQTVTKMSPPSDLRVIDSDP